MMLDSFTLHPGVIWENEITEPAAAQQVSRTILGNYDIQSVPLLKRKIVIATKDSGGRSRGYFKRDLIEHLRVAELNRTTVVLTYRDVIYNTKVAAGGVSVKPKKEIEAVDGEDPYTGSITLYNI